MKKPKPSDLFGDSWAKRTVTKTTDFNVNPRIEIQYAVVQSDSYGQTINLFKTEKQAKEYFKLAK